MLSCKNVLNIGMLCIPVLLTLIVFDEMNWVKMMSVLKRVEVDWRDHRLITD